jgi:hypothetical protein
MFNLNRIWLCDKQLKKIPNSSAITYKKAFNLRQNMLLFVQNLEYYMFEEVIETQWQTFTSAIQYNVYCFYFVVKIKIKY